MPGPPLTCPTALDGVYRARVRQGTLGTCWVPTRPGYQESWTWTLEKGTFTFHTESSHYLNKPDGSGRYTYDGDVSRHLLGRGCSTTPAPFEVRLAESGDLHFSDVRERLPENLALGQGLFSSPLDAGSGALPG